MAQPPSDVAPIVDPNTGRVTQVWRAFFSALSGKAAAAVVVPVQGSPAAYTAPDNGSLMLTGGTVTAISIVRGRDPVPVDAGLRALPMSAGDTVIVSFSVAPTLVFLPR
jgi:hypothetical protein